MTNRAKKIQRAVNGFLMMAALGFPSATLAVLPGHEGAATTAGNAGLGGADGGTSIYTIIGGIINTLLGLVGVIFLVLIIYAGFLWMTAGGNSDQVGKAKKIMLQAVVGLIIVLSAYAITRFVLERVLQATVG